MTGAQNSGPPDDDEQMVIDKIRQMYPEDTKFRTDFETRQWFINSSLNTLLDIQKDDVRRHYEKLKMRVREYCYRQMVWAAAKQITLLREYGPFFNSLCEQMKANRLPQAEQVKSSFTLATIGSVGRLETEADGDVDIDILIDVSDLSTCRGDIDKHFIRPFALYLSQYKHPRYPGLSIVSNLTPEWGYHPFGGLDPSSNYKEKVCCLTNYLVGHHCIGNKGLLRQALRTYAGGLNLPKTDMLRFVQTERVDRGVKGIQREGRPSDPWKKLSNSYKVVCGGLIMIAIRYFEEASTWENCYFRLSEIIADNLIPANKLKKHEWPIIQVAVIETILFRRDLPEDRSRADDQVMTITENVLEFDRVIRKVLRR